MYSLDSKVHVPPVFLVVASLPKMSDHVSLPSAQTTSHVENYKGPTLSPRACPGVDPGLKIRKLYLVWGRLHYGVEIGQRLLLTWVLSPNCPLHFDWLTPRGPVERLAIRPE